MVQTTWDPATANANYQLSNGNLNTFLPHRRVFGCAVDFTHQKVWVWNSNNNQWNNDILANQNPATNTGGMSLASFFGTAPLYPAGSAIFVAGDQITANFGASAFINPAPSGFSAWDATATFDPAHTSAGLTLSGGNLIATSNSGSWGISRATIGKSAGLLYFEMVATVYHGDNGIICGLVNGSDPLNSYVGSNSSTAGGSQITGGGYYGQFSGSHGDWDHDLATDCGIASTPAKLVDTLKYVFEFQAVSLTNSVPSRIGLWDGTGSIDLEIGTNTHTVGCGLAVNNIILNNTNIATPSNPAGSGLPQTCMIAVDLLNKRIWYLVPLASAFWNGNSSANPATNTGGGDISAFLPAVGQPLYIAMDTCRGGDTITNLNTAGSFVNATPAGFIPWDGAVNTNTTGLFFTT